MPQRDPLDHRELDNDVGAPGGTRHKAPLQFPSRESESGETLNIWRVSFYFVLLVVVLAGIAYLIVHPR